MRPPRNLAPGFYDGFHRGFGVETDEGELREFNLMPVLPLWTSRCDLPMASSSSFRDRDMVESSQYLEGESIGSSLVPNKLGRVTLP